jgi:hypothetical protein
MKVQMSWEQAILDNAQGTVVIAIKPFPHLIHPLCKIAPIFSSCTGPASPAVNAKPESTGDWTPH